MNRMVYQTEETRQKILDKAEKRFSEAGFFETQMKEIAASVGMSRNTLYRYYRNKTDLGFAILGRSLSRIMNRLNIALDKALVMIDRPAIERLEKILRDMLLSGENSLDKRFIAEFDAYFSGSRLPDNTRSRLQEHTTEYPNKQLRQLIEQGQNDGSIRADIDSEILDPLLINTIRATQQRLMLRGDVLIETKPTVVKEMMPQLLRVLMDGIRPRNDT